MSFHKVRFETKSPFTRIWLDEKELSGVVGADFHFNVNEVPKVTLTFIPADITIDCDTADVCIEEEDSHGTTED